MALDPSFDTDTMARVLGVPHNKHMLHRHLYQELRLLSVPHRYRLLTLMLHHSPIFSSIIFLLCSRGAATFIQSKWESIQMPWWSRQWSGYRVDGCLEVACRHRGSNLVSSLLGLDWLHHIYTHPVPYLNQSWWKINNDSYHCLMFYKVHKPWNILGNDY